MTEAQNNTQAFLQHNKFQIYLCQYSAIVLDGTTSIFVLFLCLRSFFTYKARGLLMGLLFALYVAITAFVLGNIAQVTGFTRLMNASQSNISAAFDSFVNVSKVFTYFNMVTEVCSDCAHWVFAMKYWALSCQLEMLYKREDPSKLKTKFRVIFCIGLVTNAIAGIVTAISGNPSKSVQFRILSISKSVSTLPLIASCCFLGDAFRRLNKIRQPNQLINKKQIAILSFAFGIFALGMILLQVEFLVYGQLTQQYASEFLWTYEMMILCFFASTLILSLIIYQLIIVQSRSKSTHSSQVKLSEKIQNS